MTSRQKIMIVDDKKENLAALRQVLHEVDAEVVEATSGNEALAATLHHHFAVTIMDVMMPGMDGYELAEHLRSDDKTKVIPIVFVTASYPDEQHMFKGYEVGGIDYIIKPFDPKILLGKVRVFLELDRYREELRRHRDHLEELVEEQTAELRKRVKEVQCLYAVSSLVAESQKSVEEALKAVVDLIPPGWQYPELACARITFEGLEFATPNFKKTPWRLSADIVFSGEVAGTVEVCYLEERPERDEGPFLKEERHLINDIARQLGVMIDREQGKERQKHLNMVLRSLRGVNQLITKEKEPDLLIQGACENLVQTRGFHSAWIALMDDSGEFVRTVKAGLGVTFEKLKKDLEKGRLPVCAQKALTHSGAIMVENPLTECGECPLVSFYKDHSVLSIRLECEGKLYGVLSTSTTSSLFQDQEEMGLFEELGEDIAFALYNMEREKESKKAEEALRASEEKYREFLETLPDMVYEIRIFNPNVTSSEKEKILSYVDKIKSASEDFLDEVVVKVSEHLIPFVDGSIIYSNETASKKLGYSLDRLGSIKMADIIAPEHLQAGLKNTLKILAQGRQEDIEYDLLNRDKERISTSVNSNLSELEFPFIMRGVVRDITENKRAGEEREQLQSQLRQTQKMEAIGTLAGGIAHDFNNILGAIIGYTEIAALQVPEDSKAKESLKEVLNAGRRARDLVKQILAFGRKGEQERIPIQIGPIVKEALKFLRSSLPTTVEIRQNIESDTGIVEADPTQIHQILMNLCTNAAHAMGEEGGVLEVAIRKEEVGDRDLEFDRLDMSPGNYLRLTVSDTGKGMTPEVLERIFEPYYTTKEKSEGTGLGLSVVHGIVKSHGGAIRAYSELGKGSTFHVYFPVIREPAEQIPETDKVAPIPTGNERILFIDDEPALATLGKQMLERLGYKVTIRTGSTEALELFKAKPDQFDLVITDMTMPSMTGEKLAEELMNIRSDIPVIICTGFSGHISEKKAREMGIKAFVLKPLVMRDLAKTVREVLD